MNVFLEMDYPVSLNFIVVLETLIKLCALELVFLEKLFILLKLMKWAKNKVFEFNEKFGQ